MTNSWDDFISELDAAPLPAATKPEKSKKTFPCGQCHGTGLYQGPRVHQEKAHCFACRGVGSFKTDPRKLEARRKAAKTNKAAQLARSIESFKVAQPEMYQALAAAKTEFELSLAAQLFARGTLTEKQVDAWVRGKAKLAAIIAEREAAKQAAAVTVDLSAIAEMFDRAIANGYKKPVYRALGLRIKPGKAGQLYVMTEDRMDHGFYGAQPAYEGKIADGQFFRVRETAEATPAKLLAIAADPKGEAVRYGQKTGNCACCGRPLSDAASVALGIGPICASKWF